MLSSPSLRNPASRGVQTLPYCLFFVPVPSLKLNSQAPNTNPETKPTKEEPMAKLRYLLGWLFDGVHLCPLCFNERLAAENKTVLTIRDSDNNKPLPLYTTDFYEDDEVLCYDCGLSFFDS